MRQKDEDLNARLRELFAGLANGERAALKQIVTLTAPHLNGILRQRLDDSGQATPILRMIYTQLWTVRTHDRLRREPLNMLRAYAHHCAVHADQPPNANAFFTSVAKGNATVLPYSDREREDLKDLYLTSRQAGGAAQ